MGSGHKTMIYYHLKEQKIQANFSKRESFPPADY